MKLRTTLPLLLLVPTLAYAAEVTGTLLAGGGIDDNSLTIRTPQGKQVMAYCLDRCGDWFREDANTGGTTLKPALKGRKVHMQYAVEPNRDRVAGPGSDEPLAFIHQVRILP